MNMVLISPDKTILLTKTHIEYYIKCDCMAYDCRAVTLFFYGGYYVSVILGVVILHFELLFCVFCLVVPTFVTNEIYT